MTVFGLSGTVNVLYQVLQSLAIDSATGTRTGSVNACVNILNSVIMDVNSDGPLFTTLGAEGLLLFADEVQVLFVREYYDMRIQLIVVN